MKKYKNIITGTTLALLLGTGAISCKKFEDINKNPQAAGPDQVQVEYFINASIIGAQMNPDVAERSFVLYWKTGGRQHRQTTFANGSYDDGWTSAYYDKSADWLNKINVAISIAEEKIAKGEVKEYTPNLLQVSRIWRAYLLSEFSDNFGPAPINAFQGENPEFASEKDVYYYILDELKDASSKLDISITSPEVLKKNDPAFKYDFAKWQKYANSMRMRLAMRLSEVDPSKAQAEFEDAASKPLLITMDEAFAVQERSGWDDLSGVMSREWNAQLLSPTLNNLYIGLGGVKSEVQLPAYLHDAIKPANYMGLAFADHFSSKSNDPSAGYWFDGLQNTIDPRAYKQFIVPGDVNNPEFNFYPSWADDATVTKRDLKKKVGENTEVLKELDGKYTWNATTMGDWGPKGALNDIYTWPGSNPRLANPFRNNSMQRVFFAPWETYFLLAEAGVRGWAIPGSAAEAYEKGIRSSFDYFSGSSFSGTKANAFIDAYLTSTDYNRNGTSVAWSHTAEPGNTHAMTFTNGYTNTSGTVAVNYPKNDLYKGGAFRNDLMNKILTQKFIAQTPWLPLETWNDFRRLGLPFFENLAVERPILDLPALNEGNFMTVQVAFFPQRLKYPSGFANNDPEGYAKAVQLLGGTDAVLTPLWWAKH